MKTYKRIAWVCAVLAVVGFVDATFLTIEHMRGVVAPCSLIEGCETVLTSSYAQIKGVPVALLGSLYYFTVFLFAFLSITRGERKYLVWLSQLAGVGLLASLWFVFLQIFIIKAICVYCMLSAFISTALFAIGMFVLSQRGKDDDVHVEQKERLEDNK